MSRRFAFSSVAALTALLLALFPPAPVHAQEVAAVKPGETVEITELSWEFLRELMLPVDAWLKAIENEKNEDGREYKGGSYSRTPRKVDDSTYIVSAHINTAEASRQISERIELTVAREPGKSRWEITDEKVVDTHVGLFRNTGMACAPFQKFELAREGMTLSASNGSVCEAYFEGRVSSFVVRADDLKYGYAPPEHATLVPTGHDYYAIHELAERVHQDQLNYKPAGVIVQCDVETCEEFLTSSFTGAELPAADERAKYDYDDSTIADWIQPMVNDILRARKERPFSGFRMLDEPGNRWYSIFLPSEFKDRNDGIQLSYNNWGVNESGWEVLFFVWPQRWDVPNQLTQAIYGYFSEETLKRTDPYELEQRSGGIARWLEVETIKGRVDLATIDAEKVQGDVEFGLVLRQDTDKLPFGIISNRRGGGSRPKPITVNSIRVEGEEVTWIKTGPTGGIVILPEELPAGTKLKVRMHWESSAILKFTSSYSYMPRQGWMPFVRFGDIIDEFEMTIRSPSGYEIIGIGHKVEERIEGDVRVSTWRADMPINFPTIIFGRYQSDTPGKKAVAKKLDGTEIPISIHVDKDSLSQRQIAPRALRPLAIQAANSLNLYAAMSGVDYPFGELNLVNDPVGGMLYGQAPSSIIYLGSGVFQNEAELASMRYRDGSAVFLDSSRISMFLKSVVAHEVGHQWWGNRIAHANDRNYWFVESLAEYFSAIYMEYAHGWGDYMAQVEQWRRKIMNSTLKGNVQNATTLFAGESGGGRSESPVTAAIYNKGPYAFHMLRETFKGQGPRGAEGADARFFAFLKQATQELAEKREIVTFDIQRAAEKGLGGVDKDGNPYSVDLNWFFDQWIRGSGMPQYRLNWDYRQAEDGSYVISGKIEQRVMLGQSDQVIEGAVYRGVVDLTVEAKGGPYSKRFIINAAETPVQLKVPAKPVDIALNGDGEMLALDTKYNEPW